MPNSETDRIRKEFRRSDEAKYIHRLHGVLLVLNGLSTVKAGELLGEPQRTVAEWSKRYKQHGIAGLMDAPKSGRPKLLSPKEEAKLKRALEAPPRKWGIQSDSWTGEFVSQFLREQFGIKMTIRNGRRILREIESGEKGKR